MKRILATTLALVLLLLPGLSLAERLTLSVLDVRLTSPEGFVVVRESLAKGSGDYTAIIEQAVDSNMQFYLRVAPIGEGESVNFAGMGEEELTAFLKASTVAYEDIEAILMPMGAGINALQVRADAGKYFGMFIVEAGYLVSGAVSVDSHTLLDSDREELAALLDSMERIPGTENDMGTAMWRGARLLAEEMRRTAEAKARATQDPTAAPAEPTMPPGDGDISFP